jgi:hypothetical protein
MQVPTTKDDAGEKVFRDALAKRSLWGHEELIQYEYEHLVATPTVQSRDMLRGQVTRRFVDPLHAPDPGSEYPGSSVDA